MPSAQSIRPCEGLESSCLVRVLTTCDKLWSTGQVRDDTVATRSITPRTTAELAATTFTRADDEPVSVYRCDDHYSEAAVAAALTTTRAQVKPKDPVLILRIPAWLPPRFGLTLDAQSTGTIGIAAIDARHRDLLGPASKYERMTRWLFEHRCAGLDLVRAVQPATLSYHYRLMARMSENEIESNASKRANAHLRRVTDQEDQYFSK